MVKEKERAERGAGKKFLAGAAVLAAGGLIAKILGAFYRIPLTNVMGAAGMGIYQLVFPMYALLLTVGSSGLNVAVSRLVAERNKLGDTAGAKKVFKDAMTTLGVLGVAGSLLLFLAAAPLARLQGDASAAAAYRCVSPSVFLVCIIAGLRGYFQGGQIMYPTALSQIIEQAVKMVFAILLAMRFMPDTVKAACGALAAVTLSEAAALVFLGGVFLVNSRRAAFCQKAPSSTSPKNGAEVLEGGDDGNEAGLLERGSEGNKFATLKPRGNFKTLILLALPITAAGLIIPLTQFIDSVLVVNILNGYRTDAVAMYGLLTGPVNSLINLPVAVILGLATAAVPAVAAARVSNDTAGMKKKINLALSLSLIFAVPAAVVMFAAAAPAFRFLYRGISGAEFSSAVTLLRISSVNIIFLSLLSVATAVLQAAGRIYAPVKNLLFAAVLKIVLNAALLPRANLNIYAAALANVFCYATAAIFDLAAVLRLTPRVKRSVKIAN